MDDYHRYSGAYSIFTVVATLVLTVLSIHLREYGYTDVQLGLVFAIFPFAIMFALPRVGRLADLYGKRKIILIAILIHIISLILYLIPYNIWIVSLARLLDAITISSLSMIALAKIEDGVTEKRGEKSGWFLSFGHVGKLVAGVIAAWMADYLFVSAPILLSIILLLFTYLWLYEKEERHFKKLHLKDLSYWTQIRTFLSFKPMRGMAILGIAAHALYPAMVVYFPLYITENLGMPIAFVGYAMLVQGFTHIFQMYFGKISDKRGPGFGILLGLGLAAICWGAVMFSTSYLSFLVMMFFAGTATSIWNVSAVSLMGEIGAKNKCEGVITTAYVSIAKIGSFLSALVSGFVVSFFGYGILTLGNAVLLLIGCALAYPFLKEYIY